MKTLNDIRHLLNDDAIRFVDMWVNKHWDAEVLFTYQSCINWICVCIPHEDLYSGNGLLPSLVSLSTKVSGGAKSTFFGDVRHFVRIAAANIAYRRGKGYNGRWCDDTWFNYEWCRRVEKWLKYRYGINV